MPTALALIEPIQLPAKPDQMPSWPAWLQQRIVELESGTDILPNGLPDPFAPPMLPAEMLLSSSERAMVEHHIEGLSRFLDVGQPFMHRERLLTNDQAIGVLVAALLIRRKGAKLDKAASDALTEDYLDAIEDLPAWTVRGALRKWNRGESVRVDPKKPHDFTWSPEPPTLRYLAMVERAGVSHRIRKLQRLLGATPRPTEDQLADGRAAMAGLSIALTSGDMDAVRALTFEQAIERGERDRALAAKPIGNDTAQLPALLRTFGDKPADAHQEAE